MRLFAIDTDNNITAFPAAEQIPEGQEHFASEKELAKLATTWPGDRLIQVWNGFAGVTPFDELKPVKKFTDRKSAVARIWKAIQRLDAAPAPQAANVATKTKKSRKATKVADGAPTAREGSKKATVLELVRRPGGATLKEIMAATSWQAHSVRGFISGSLTKKMGLKIESIKREDGERAYVAH
ncbi:MAG TPA: DUF3489 domain-containing protein [Bryobacteraceae bacterium]|nr:DUF3489 domain-containing protein [Bryobacteraceae bacterium]